MSDTHKPPSDRRPMTVEEIRTVLRELLDRNWPDGRSCVFTVWDERDKIVGRQAVFTYGEG